MDLDYFRTTSRVSSNVYFFFFQLFVFTIFRISYEAPTVGEGPTWLVKDIALTGKFKNTNEYL